MRRHGASIGKTIQAICLACVAALTLGAAPPIPAEQPLFKPEDFRRRAVHVVPEHYTMQAFGAFFAPVTGPWAGLSTIYAGTDDRYQVWLLEGVLTEREPRIACGAATLALLGAQPPVTAPLVGAASLLAGHHFNCWPIQDINRFRRLPREMLTVVKDNEPLLLGDIETEVYGRVLGVADTTSPWAFGKAAREDITARNLLADPKHYRGEVVGIEGILKLVTRNPPTPEASRLGVGNIYEAWIQPERMGAQVMVAVFTTWPAGLSRNLIGKELSRRENVVRVRFSGYFFKSFKYDAIDRDGPTKRVAPMLIGNSLELPLAQSSPRENVASWVKPLVYAVPVMFVALIFAVVGLTYWFRRTDAQLQKRLLAARNREFIAPLPDAVPVAAPVTAPASPARIAAFPMRAILPPRSDRQGGNEGNGSAPGEGSDKPPGEDAGG